MILAALKLLEGRLFSHPRRRRVRLQTRSGALSLAELEADVAAQRLQLLQLSVRRQGGADEIELLFNRDVSDAQMMTLMQHLRAIDGLDSLQLETLQ